jgi:hypothetical protein
MAEEEQVEVTSTASRPAGRKYPGMSPLQAGLAYGGAASTVMGPLVALVGIVAGIGAKKMRDNWLDHESKYAQNLRAEQIGLQQELDGEKRQGDPDEVRLLDHAKRLATDGWYRLQQGDSSGRDLISQANEISRGIMNADAQARKQEEAQVAGMQRTMLQTSADALRTQYLDHLKMAEEIDKQSQRVLELVAADGFDPNKPFNKAVLSDLLSVGVGGLYKDDPGGLAALASAVPYVGKFLEGGVQFQKSEDYKLTAEDFNRIALELKASNTRYTQQTMNRLGASANELDAFGRKIGAIRGEFGIGDYVTGGVRKLEMTPAPKYTPPKKQSVTSDVSGPTGLFSDSPMGKRIQQWVDKKTQPRRRPTN